MPTKTDRILGYLPTTFRAQPTQSALRAVADAFGAELQRGENVLAEVMQAHWVDFADRGAAAVVDLARMSALYGLMPRDDETVEQFRVHLTRYVRTLLAGTVTVQGILRIAAEALGLTVDDALEDLDAWWRRADDELVTVEADRADATRLLLGVPDVDVSGVAARRAQVVGTPDLSSGVDLHETHLLYVVVDAGAPVVVDLTEGAADPSHVSLEDVVARLSAVVGGTVARAVGGRLVLTSPTSGPDSLLEVRQGPDDAATAVLGLLPLGYRGSAARSAVMVGTGDHAAGIDLTDARYLRLLVDGTRLAEVDCAGNDPARTSLDQVRDAINAALGIDVATHDGHRLTLTSPTAGRTSRIEVQRAAAEDAAERLLGVPPSVRSGEDPRPARLVGTTDLRAGIDLSVNSLLRLRVDDLPTVTVNCAGAVPEHTGLDEVVTSVNSAMGVPVAAAVGGHLQLTSPSTGELAELSLDPVSGDAAPTLLGLPPRHVEGTAATPAHVTGTADLSGGAVVSSRHNLQIAVDGGRWTSVDLREGSTRVPLDDLVARLNAALGDDVATHDGQHLVLRSRHPGGGSRVQVRPASLERRRRFVSRAVVTGEAARTLLGVDRATALGDSASRAVVTGSADVSHGVDLSTAGYLRIALDGASPVDVRCAGVRPRATVLDEIVPALNARLQAPGAPPFASQDGAHLTLQSSTPGPGSRIAFEVPQAQDARGLLLGDAPTSARGEDAAGITFIGIPDLSGGVDLPAHAALGVGVDDAQPVDVALTGEDPAHRSLSALAATINAALGAAIAAHDGIRLALTSPTRGARARLVLSAPADPAAVDATGPVLGVGDRTYHGSDARRAEITGTADVTGNLDLAVTRYLVLAVDGRDPVTVDCAATVAPPAPATIANVVTAVNTAVHPSVASVVDGRLVLQSVAAGSGGRISVEPHRGGDARAALLGPDVPAETLGLAALPAVLTGTVDLLGPADLSSRSTLLLQVDDGPPREIDVAGSAPAQTTLDEVVAAVDAVLPGVATPTPDRRLRLISPTTGPASRVAVLPLRSLEVLEFPPVQAAEPVRRLRHADQVSLDNDGAGDSFLTVRIQAAQGNGGPALIDRDGDRFVALMRPLAAGDAATLWRAVDGRVLAGIESPAGAQPVAIPPTQIRAGRPGAWTAVPTPGPRAVPTAGLQLVDPWAARIDDVLPRVPASTVDVRPAAVALTAFDIDRPDGSGVTMTATLRLGPDGWRLHGAGDAELIAARAGAGVTFREHDGMVVGVTATFWHDEPPYLLVTSLSRRFDVSLGAAGVQPETYADVTVGGDPSDEHAFARAIDAGAQPSRLARVRSSSPGDALRLDRGRSHWQVLECTGSRLDDASFGERQGGGDEAHFAGGSCRWPGVFGVSTFATVTDADGSVLSPSPPTGPPSDWTFSWLRHEPGAFEVNLPADLPAGFGGRFDQARFASDPRRPELYEHVVTEPPGDDSNLVALINGRSGLVRAEVATTARIGFTPVPLPTRTPHRLSGGAGPRSARLYLQEDGVDGFVLIEARINGPDGNLVSVSSRPAGPARFDVTIVADGARFESARAIVAGPPPVLANRSTLEPTPLGVDEAKAAGTRVRVTRDRSGP
ncbi:MAG TPA: hypothetical protein VGD09_00480 [Blastococcus sp.]